jgi:hypothetical protein
MLFIYKDYTKMHCQQSIQNVKNLTRTCGLNIILTQLLPKWIVRCFHSEV